MNYQWIVIHVCSEEQARFFLRFIPAGNYHKYMFAFITYTYSVYEFLKDKVSLNNQTIFLNRQHYYLCKDKSYSIDYAKLLECITKYISKNDAHYVYYGTIGALEKLGKQNIAYIWCWNGCKIVDSALSAFAKKYNIKTLYFEIANIDGKIFVDPAGTNCRSFLYKYPEILQHFKINYKEYKGWREKYIESKYTQTTVKQAKTLNIQNEIFNYFLDDFGYFFKSGLVIRHFPGITLKKKLNHITYKFTKVNYSNFKYVFFPLQVSFDTQILINGNITLLEAISRVLEYARKKNYYLVIKPHPAEQNLWYLNKIRKKLNSYDKVIFSSENTFLLLQNAEDIFTINSTVGLEAMILNRPVHIFGKALYEKFSEENISQYIMGYLINIDYWGDNIISNLDFLNILSRADLKNRL